MRALASCVLALGLFVSSAIAATGDKDSPAANTSTPSAATQPANAPAAVANTDPASKATASSAEISAELQQLRDLLESQAKQLQEQQQKMQLLEEQLNAATSAHAALASAPATGDPGAVGPAAVDSASPLSVRSGDDKDNPVSIVYKGVTITPGGFMAAETVWRQKALSADVNTPFNSAPFDGSSAAHISEFNASGRQSRFSLLTEGKLDGVKIGGYYETDFLSAGTTSNDNQSNSYTLRVRQFYGQAAFTSGFTVTGGQQWSLLTETTHGMDNRSEALPLTIDANYSVGFSWARQFGFRVTKNFGNKIWLGMAVEEAQTNAVTVHGNPTAQAPGTTVACTPAGVGTCSAAGTLTIDNSAVFNNFLVGQFGASGGLYSPTANYAFNESPDLVFKAVFEPGFGHYEIFGVLSQFRDRVFPCVPLTGTVAPVGCPSTTSGDFASNDSRTAGGVGANARWSLLQKKVDVGIHVLGGSGIGRYGSGGLPDATARPDGTLVPLRNYQALGTLQFHPVPKLDIYMNVGGEYSDRAQYAKTIGGALNDGYGLTTSNNSGCWTETQPVTGPATNTNTGVPTGIGGTTGFIPGPLANCTGDTRNLIEGTLGFWYRFYSGPKGRVQYGMQYSNFIRNTWRGALGTPGNINFSGQPHSDENMVLTSFRYYLP
jgi:hypothetical protein